MVSTTFSSILKEEKEDKNDFRFCCRHMTYLLHELRLDELLHDCTWFHVRGRSTTKWIKLYPNLTPYPQGHVKGQIKPKAGLARRRFSQKTNQQICFVCCEKQKSKQNKFVCPFLGRIYGVSICFRFYLTFRVNFRVFVLFKFEFE